MAVTGVGRYSELLRRMLDVPGGSAAIGREISPDIVPVLVLENDRPEWAYLKGERLSAGFHTVAAGGVGVFSSILLHNPPDSGMLVVLEHALAGAAAAVRFDLYVRTAAGVSNLGTRFCRDLRFNEAPAARISTSTSVAGTRVGFLRPVTRDSAEPSAYSELAKVVILPAGAEARITCSTADVGFAADFTWRERALPRVER